MKLHIQWIKHASRDVFATKTVDPRNGRTYYGAWVPRRFAERMGMTAFTVQA